MLLHMQAIDCMSNSTAHSTCMQADTSHEQWSLANVPWSVKACILSILSNAATCKCYMSSVAHIALACIHAQIKQTVRVTLQIAAHWLFCSGCVQNTFWRGPSKLEGFHEGITLLRAHQQLCQQDAVQVL